MKLRLGLFALAVSLPLLAEDVAITADILNLRDVDFEHARPNLNRSASTTRENGRRNANAPLRIAGAAVKNGIGTQVDTRIAFAVNGATRFIALAGVDDATANDTTAPVRFEVLADGQSLWKADLKRGGAAARVDVDLRGKKVVVLTTLDIGNNYSQAFADWADAKFTVDGAKPKSTWPQAVAEPREILTPKPAAAPQINSPRVFGVRPGNPFFFQIAATGERPMKYAAENLPAGLKLDAATGRITGTLTAPGSQVVTLHAANARGTADGKLRIEVGEKIALTPPMGWNSWNCWGVSVDQQKVLASARAMISKGLAEHGWSYINIDDTWQGARTGPDHALQANEKFPAMKQLCDELHGMGLRAGIYSTPWDTSYAGFAGGSSDDPNGKWSKDLINDANNRKRRHHGTYSFAEADAKQWAAWGMDYLKYDWNPKGSQPPESEEQFKNYVGTMTRALRASGRDMVYSYSNSFPFEWIAENVDQLNAWRTTGDIHDSWGSLRGIWFQQDKWRPYGGPGHWNDPDMLVVGPVDVGNGKNIRESRLTPNEQYTHISLWCLLSAPLLIGCPLERADDFTINLLTNDEVLALDQDELGAPAAQVVVDGRKQIYVKRLADGSHAVGLFNLAEEPQEVSAPWSQINLPKPKHARDLWRQKDLAAPGDKVSATVPRHGVVLLRVW